MGLLGGTFNPPHNGHVVCARAARLQLGLERVDLVPVFAPPHKEIEGGDPGADVRLELCRLAVREAEGLGVCDVEVRRGGPSYTVDTLRELDAEESELTFIVGGDMALSLSTWREPAEVLRLARLAIAERGEATRDRIEQALAPFPGARIDFFAMPSIDISSSDVRAAVAAGRSVRELVPAAVADAIEQRGLYR